MTRVAVILHERLGTWAAQLRPRICDPRVRWIETRSAADLAAALEGLSHPVLLIDVGKKPLAALDDLARASEQSPGARILALDPEKHDGVAELARELGATCVRSGFVPPPEVASLLERWIALGLVQTDREGWSRPFPSRTPEDVDDWLELATDTRAAAIEVQAAATGPYPPGFAQP
jgi:hypothetical protein